VPTYGVQHGYSWLQNRSWIYTVYVCMYGMKVKLLVGHMHKKLPPVFSIMCSQNWRWILENPNWSHGLTAVVDKIETIKWLCWYWNWFAAETHTHTHTHLTALFLELPRWAGTRKGKPIGILKKYETVSGSGISRAMCKSAPCSRQITLPAPHHSVFYRPDALPAALPTASKHWRQSPNIQFTKITMTLL